MTDPELVLHENARTVERALIGALLVDRDAVLSVADWLKPGAFADWTCRTLYEAILVCYRDRIPPDLLTIRHGLDANGIELGTLNWADVAAMTGEAATAVHAPHYAQLVANAAKQRALINLGADLIQGGYRGGSFDYEKAVAAAFAHIDGYGNRTDELGNLQNYNDAVPDYRDRLERIWSGEIQPRIIPSGFRELDRLMRGGFRPGDLTVIAGRPGMAKSAFALALAHNCAQLTGEYAVLFSMEMKIESLLERAIATVSGKSPDVIESGATTEQNRQDIRAAMVQLRAKRVAIDDTSGLTTAHMRQRTKRLQTVEPVGLVLIDYLELAADTAGENETKRVGNIALNCKRLAMDCNVPVVLLAQLSRKVEERANKRPQLQDLRQSGEIEQHADRVGFLYRDGYYVQQGALRPGADYDPERCELIIAKQRNGKVGTARLRFIDSALQFVDY